MADIGIAKVGIRAATVARTNQTEVQKTQPSKFDSIRLQLAERLQNDLQASPTKQISEQQAANLESALRKSLSQTPSTNPSSVFAPQLGIARANLTKLSASVAKLPENKNSVSLRDSLSTIETMYQQTARLVGGSKGMDLQSLLKIQSELYRMSENIDVLSKVVDQVTSGVKTIFQTQVG
jgi:hypothetical protein